MNKIHATYCSEAFLSLFYFLKQTSHWFSLFIIENRWKCSKNWIQFITKYSFWKEKSQRGVKFWPAALFAHAPPGPRPAVHAPHRGLVVDGPRPARRVADHASWPSDASDGYPRLSRKQNCHTSPNPTLVSSFPFSFFLSIATRTRAEEEKLWCPRWPLAGVREHPRVSAPLSSGTTAVPFAPEGGELSGSRPLWKLGLGFLLFFLVFILELDRTLLFCLLAIDLQPRFCDTIDRTLGSSRCTSTEYYLYVCSSTWHNGRERGVGEGGEVYLHLGSMSLSSWPWRRVMSAKSDTFITL